MAYAVTDDVLARAGRVGGAFDVAGRRPNLADVDAFLVSCASEIDEAIRARGFDPGSMGADAEVALLDLNAYGALSRALAAMDPSGRQDGVDELLLQARKTWGAAMGDPTSNTAEGQRGSIASGTHPVIRALEAGATAAGPGPSAGALWSEEPGYGGRSSVLEESAALGDSNLGPRFSRDMVL